jgi:transcriptional regulator with GAF, ATPase, and Fis domain
MPKGSITEENRQLRQTIRDLVALAVLPPGWVGKEPQQIADGMADLLLTSLRLEAAYVRLNHPEKSSVEATRHENCPAFSKWLESSEPQVRRADGKPDRRRWVRDVLGNPERRRIELPTDQGTLYISITPIGLEGELGLIVLGVQRPDFPTELETQVLSVAVMLTVSMFQTATLVQERKHAEHAMLALREEIDRASMFEEIVGSSPALQGVLSRITQVAPTDSTVLIVGETGTGKELVAHAIHKRSQRSGRAFVTVNCAALPPSLIPSELFGHEKGAFTGAHQRRIGRFELAEGGTIFLDEIGELPAETQILLLHVLQEREFERVGGSQRISTDVRVIAATNRNLAAAIDAGSFRLDLFFRLNVFPIVVPPLRERNGDIPILAEYFIQIYAAKLGKKTRGMDQKTLEMFQAYRWPGNIRELQNVIERSLILCNSDTFSVDKSWLQTESLQSFNSSSLLAEMLLEKEKEAIETALKESKGRVAGPTGAAAKLGIPPSTLESKIKVLKISKNHYRAA